MIYGDIFDILVVGDCVRYYGASINQIRYGNNDDPRGVFLRGQDYIIAEVKVCDWHTKLRIEGVVGWYNSVHFVVKEEL